MSLDTVLKIGIEEAWLIKTTGDPFADVGGYVIEILQEKFPEKDILGLIEFITDIYIKDWKAGLHSFFLNSTITQPAFESKRKKTETLYYFKSIIENTEKYLIGNCRISGRQTLLFSAGRHNSIMSGSGTFVNFHHSFEEGIYVSKEILIRFFFVPYGVLYLSDKLALIYSNSKNITKYFVKQNLNRNIENKSSNISDGVIKSEFHNPANSLFEFANDCIMNSKVHSEEENISLSMYHFTNFGAKPEIYLYTFPANLFTFYKNCLNPLFKKDWQTFIRSNYSNSKFKNSYYNENSDKIIFETKKENLSVGYEEFKTWTNKIYNKLLNNESIIKNILRWSVKHKFDFRITSYYQIYLRNMDKKTIQKIEEISLFIIKDSEKDMIKKSITRLNSLKKSYELRAYLLLLIKNNFNEGNKKSLVTLNEYVEFLFPDGVNWSEIRDLLLISIYEKLHEKNIQLEIELPEIENEENEVN